MIEIRTTRLQAGDQQVARELFELLATVFGEESGPLSDHYIAELLGREDFWAIAAFVDGEVVGGITAHTLPMTGRQACEMFIYDVAVREQYQRKGVGRRLIAALSEAAAAAGVDDIFVAADNSDVHALDFYRALGGVASPVTVFTFERYRALS